jgi:ssRNA-specific RNase YbeY (16S rRNA maturation enzyme)
MGYDHETSEDDARVMEEKSQELIKQVSGVRCQVSENK